mgnify:CR=1 FL=1
MEVGPTVAVEEAAAVPSEPKLNPLKGERFKSTQLLLVMVIMNFFSRMTSKPL